VHPYLVGDVTGRSVIDSVRAARALDTGLELQRRYAVWGESQGGHAALFTGQVAAEGYAPELRLVGVGAAAPASDLAPLLKAAQGAPAGKVLTSQAVVSWTRIHPELSFDDTVVRRARAPVRAVARRCLFPNLYVVAAQTIAIPKRMLAIDITTDPGWSARLAENTPSGRIAAPVLLAQGQRDQIVSPAVQRAYVARRCAAGQPIDFRELPDSGHVDVMRAAGPLLLDWTARLFAGTPVPEGCGTPRGG
jgi:acetyl esterase/lipase